jgi:hypothetical protein
MWIKFLSISIFKKRVNGHHIHVGAKNDCMSEQEQSKRRSGAAMVPKTYLKLFKNLIMKTKSIPFGDL